MKLSAMITTFQDVEFIDASIKSIKDNVDQLVITEGSYSERHKMGIPARSTDGTIDICRQHADGKKVLFFQANEQSDPQQRNFCLEKIKQFNKDGWFLIVDSDEVWDPNMLLKVKSLCKAAEKENIIHAAYFTSMTFINDAKHFTFQHFPRLFRITPECRFVNDNFLSWDGIPWSAPYVIRREDIKYFHYSFCKGTDKLNQKRDWWMSRGLGKDWDYGWKVDENGKITDDNHTIFLYEGKHLSIMNNHPLMIK